MQVQASKNFSIDFKAKVFLNDKALLKGTPYFYQNTPMDAMFKENRTVKFLNGASEFIKNKLLCKYFENPSNKILKTFAYIQYKLLTNLRKYADKIFFLKNKNEINKINNFFEEHKETSPEYINELAKIGNSIEKKYIVTNTEDNILDKITNTNEATIFVLNHPNYHKDKFIYAFINSILNKLYVKKGQQNNCPRPKILVSKNITKVVNQDVINIYKKLGLTLVDASKENKNSLYNAKNMKPIINGVLENKLNLFIFPEGNNSVYKNKPLESKIQSGIADLIRICAGIKKTIRVVPIGITYTKSDKNNLGNIFIGQPLLFSNKYCQCANARQNILKVICNSLKLCVENSKTVQ